MKKKWFNYLPAYIPPLAILSFLLLTNLFTRSRELRGFLFPERTIVISAQYDEELSDGNVIAPMNDAGALLEKDSVGCNDSAYLSIRSLIGAKEYAAAIKLYTAMLDTSSCSRSTILNSIGIAYMKMPKFHEAESTFRRATEADSENVHAWYNLGLCQSRRGYLTQAYDAYRRAVRLNPGMNEAYFNLGILALKQKQYSEARLHFRAALDWGSEKPVCLYNIALSYQREDSSEQALRDYRECIRFEPRQTAARLRLVEIYQARGVIDSAISLARQAVAIEPENPEILIRLAQIEISGKNFDAAFGSLSQAEKLRPGSIEIAYQRARIYGLKGDNKRALSLYREIMANDPSNPRVYYNTGVNLMDLGMDREALEAYARSLKADPSYWKSAYNLGVYYLKKNLPLEAVQFFRHVVEITPERPQAHYNLGLAYLKTGDLDEARTSFAQSVRLDSTYVEGRYNLALTLMKNGENDSAKAVFKSVLKYSPCHSKSFFNLGLLSRRTGNSNEADNYYLRAIECKKGLYPSAWYSRALCKMDIGQLDSALRCISHATTPADSEPISAKALLLQARLYDTLGFTDSINFALRRADSLCGNDPEALQELAEFYAQRGIVERALAIYRQIVHADTLNTDIFLAAAAIEMKAGKPDSAEALFKKVIAVDNRNIEALKEYAKLLMQLHRNEDALRVLQNAIFLDPASVDARLETVLIFADEKRTAEYKREVDKLRRIPMNSTEAFSTGKKLFRAKLYNDALFFFHSAANGASDKPDIRYFLLLCRESNEKDGFQPIREWKDFVNDFPHYGKGYLELAKAYIKTSSWKSAKENLTTMLTLEDSDEARFALIEVCLGLGDAACVEEQKTRYLKNNPEEQKRKELYALLSKKQ